MRSFQASIEQMLWPEKREQDSKLGAKIPGAIDRTTARSFLRVSGGYLPDALQKTLGVGQHLAPWLFGDGGIELGPIPGGHAGRSAGEFEPAFRRYRLAKRLQHDEKLLNLVVTLGGDLTEAAEGRHRRASRAGLGQLRRQAAGSE